MQDNDKATTKKGHATMMCQQHTMMKRGHNDVTTVRTWNEDTMTRLCEDKVTIRIQQNDIMRNNEDTAPHEWQ